MSAWLQADACHHHGRRDPLFLCPESWVRMLTSATGELQSVDGYMNIALEKTEEYVNGQKRRSYGDAFVRGNNGKSRNPNHLDKIDSLTESSPSHVHLCRLVVQTSPDDATAGSLWPGRCMGYRLAEIGGRRTEDGGLMQTDA